MKTLKMDSYEVYVESGLIKEVAGLIMKATTSRKAMLISDSNVASLYSEAVLGKLNNNGFETEMFIFEAGEENKNINPLDNILGAMSNFSLSRSDIVIALGGGVVSDLVGFAASIYLRGIDFIAVPTTLLAQIDAAVGGKNGCDLKNGKNLIGSFYNPRMVIVDPQLLETLPKTVFNDGLAEAVKYGVIRSKKLFEALRDNEPEDFIEDLIYECLKIKIHLVENDFRDNGERMILNFGHTVAHAIEQYYNYKEITHGQAV
ncbi:MAG: 3-dehydroquinate synthase family protein, partial [Oscillospiraceae bacterium]